MIQISWSKAAIKASNCGCSVKEITQCGNAIGLEIDGKLVRADIHGWYDAAKVDEAIGPEKIPVSLTGLRGIRS